MYAVVGCTQCGSYWLLSDPGESASATCPRCGRSHQTKKLKRFFESEDRDAARQARAALLAKKHGDSAEFADVAHVSELEAQLDDRAVSDEEFLEGSGIDADEVAAAGETRKNAARSRDEIVRDAVREHDTEADVLDYAEEHGVPRDAASDLLEKLRRRGDVVESGGTLRLL